jgi:hypothetical protein
MNKKWALRLKAHELKPLEVVCFLTPRLLPSVQLSDLQPSMGQSESQATILRHY